MTSLVGRGTSEKVTLESSFSTIEGPMPFTRKSPSLEPKGPNESRSATILFARAGPICLRFSISFTPARSRSTGPTGLGGLFLARSRFGLWMARRAESAAFIWSSRAERARESAGDPLRSARKARVEAPRTRTTVKKRSAFRSAGVGMMRPYQRQSGLRHRRRAAGSVLFHRGSQKQCG
jgi:hypothetical protein